MGHSKIVVITEIQYCYQINLTISGRNLLTRVRVVRRFNNMDRVTAEIHEVLVHTMLFKFIIYSEIIHFLRHNSSKI